MSRAGGRADARRTRHRSYRGATLLDQVHYDRLMGLDKQTLIISVPSRHPKPGRAEYFRNAGSRISAIPPAASTTGRCSSTLPSRGIDRLDARMSRSRPRAEPRRCRRRSKLAPGIVCARGAPEIYWFPVYAFIRRAVVARRCPRSDAGVFHAGVGEGLLQRGASGARALPQLLLTAVRHFRPTSATPPGLRNAAAPRAPSAGV